MRLIDGDRLYEIFKNGMNRIPFIEEDRDMFYHQSGYNCAMTGAYIEVEKAPTIEAVPVVHGEWMLRHIGAGHMWECSVCHKRPDIYVKNDTNFCPNCGADMRKGGA